MEDKWETPRRTVPIMPIVVGVFMIGVIIHLWYTSNGAWEESLKCASTCEPYAGVVENERCYCDQTKKSPSK